MGILSFITGKHFDEQPEEESTETEEMYALNTEETEEFFTEYKQSDVYQRYRAIKDGTYRKKYGRRQ